MRSALLFLTLVAALLVAVGAVQDDLQVLGCFFLFFFFFFLISGQELQHERRVLLQTQQERRAHLLRVQMRLKRQLMREEMLERRRQLRALQALQVPETVAEEARARLRAYDEQQMERVRRLARHVRRATRRQHRQQRRLLRDVQEHHKETAEERLLDARIWD